MALGVSEWLSRILEFARLRRRSRRTVFTLGVAALAFLSSGPVPDSARAAVHAEGAQPAAKDYSRFLTERWKGTYTHKSTATAAKAMNNRLDYSETGTVTLYSQPDHAYGVKVWEGPAEISVHYMETINQPALKLSGTLTGNGTVKGTATLEIDLAHGGYSFDVDYDSDGLQFECHVTDWTGTHTHRWGGGRDSDDGGTCGLALFAAVPWTLRAEATLPDSGRLLTNNDKPAPNPLLDLANAAVGGGLAAGETWSLIPGDAEELEVVVTIPNYNTWIPEGGTDERTPGNQLVVTAELKSKNSTKPLRDKAVKFVFELAESSSEPGVCLNYPQQPITPPPKDLAFDVTDRQLKQMVSLDAKNGTTAKATINSFDYGAWGTLHVTAIMGGGHKVEGHLAGHDGETDILLPKRSKESKIADQWKEDETKWARSLNEGAVDVTQLADDDDSDDADPAHGTPGDGLTLYEEYRGFRIARAHVRTHPTQKDLFVYNEKLLAPQGFTLFQKASGIAVHLILGGKDNREFAQRTKSPGGENPNVINFNAGSAHLGDQHVLDVKNESLPGPAVGEGGFGVPPKGCEVVKIDQEKILDLYADGNSFLVAGKTFPIPPGFAQQELATTVAHELAHCTGVKHHGDVQDLEVPSFRYAGAKQKQPNGKWEKIGGHGVIAVEHGRASGVEDCIMRYCVFEYYEVLEERFADIQWGRKYAAIYPPVEKSGTVFCTTEKGTGVNLAKEDKPSKAGDAAKGRGNCLAQFHVTDLK